VSDSPGSIAYGWQEGAHTQDWKKHIKKSIFMTPEGDRALSEQFNTWKDIVIPGLENDKEFWSGKLRGLPLERRDIFAFFRGTIVNKGGSSYSKGIRIRMEAALRPHEDVVFAEQGSECNRQCYRDSMRKSVFCLCPRGWSPWTLRAYQVSPQSFSTPSAPTTAHRLFTSRHRAASLLHPPFLTQTARTQDSEDTRSDRFRRISRPPTPPFLPHSPPGRRQ
jgi:hypothetical protein